MRPSLYLQLTKPGIIYGNAITAAAAFLLASKNHFDFKLFLITLIGLSLIIGSACAINNIFDQDIDSHMERTKNRALVTGEISRASAMIFSLILVVLGAWILGHYVNYISLGSALVGFLVYVFLYTPLKRRSIHATLVGAIAGATPPVVGYTAVTNHMDLGAWLLFFILVAWQMPHFYAIAIRRIDEYRAAHIPVLPIKKGIRFTKINILFYVLAFIIATILLRVYKFTGNIYLAVILILGLVWVWLAIQGFSVLDDKAWAKKMFLSSLAILLIFSLTIAISGIIKI